MTLFTCFSKLPAELQLMIWVSALPGPRMIAIAPTSEMRFGRHWSYNGITCESDEDSETLVALYHTCKDSHDIVKKAGYKLCFASRLKGPAMFFRGETDAIHFSLIDAFYFFTSPDLADVVQDDELQTIKYIAMPCPSKEPAAATMPLKFGNMYYAFKSFPGLRIMVLNTKESFSQEEVRLLLEDFRAHYLVFGHHLFGGRRGTYDPRLLDRDVKIKIVHTAR
ncbi:hypothetical protein EG329_005486 [Mollisiaceae sp. DMI_Dod_QoI]|nr:hypothetical protein EG329_005486 [Helotiales sp. DMI_Dod_QoI]